MANCKVIAVTNQKGGVGKTTTTANLGIGLAHQNKRVLLIDADAQGSLTLSLGYPKPDELPVTLADIMQNVIDDTPIPDGCGILHHGEGVDLLPANIELSGMEIRLINAMSRESVLRTYINAVKPHYDYILVDCMPSLGMMPINSLAAADSVIIPSQPSYLSAKGLDLLMQSIAKVKTADQPETENRRHPVHDGGQPYQRGQGDHRISACPLRRKDPGIRDGDPLFRPSRRNQRPGQEHFCPRQERQGRRRIPLADEGGVGA